LTELLDQASLLNHGNFAGQSGIQRSVQAFYAALSEELLEC
jgi:hypothetical protein